MKEDALVPEKVPKKRRQLEAALDRWLPVWLERDDLTPSERRRVEEERERRRRNRDGEPTTLGLLIGAEGMTPEQRLALAEYKAAMKPASVIEGGDFQAVVKASTVAFAAPRHAREPKSGEPGVWAGIRYARHRKVPVRVILPSGKEL